MLYTSLNISEVRVVNFSFHVVQHDELLVKTDLGHRPWATRSTKVFTRRLSPGHTDQGIRPAMVKEPSPKKHQKALLT